MRGRKTSLVVLLTEYERDQLQRWARSTSLPAGLVTRAQAVLFVAQGMPLSHTGKAVRLTERHVRQWVQRFQKERLDGLSDRPGRGRKPSFSP
jgi:putative transposase